MTAQVVEEMQVFRNMLDERGILWADRSDNADELLTQSEYSICRTYVEFGDNAYSVINGFGTRGGYDNRHKQNAGYLEWWDFQHEPIGWLSAQEAFKKITGKWFND